MRVFTYPAISAREGAIKVGAGASRAGLQDFGAEVSSVNPTNRRKAKGK
jgi:hypothetical protein